jgi:hypothetical protein
MSGEPEVVVTVAPDGSAVVEVVNAAGPDVCAAGEAYRRALDPSVREAMNQRRPEEPGPC